MRRCACGRLRVGRCGARRRRGDASASSLSEATRRRCAPSPFRRAATCSRPGEKTERCCCGGSLRAPPCAGCCSTPRACGHSPSPPRGPSWPVRVRTASSVSGTSRLRSTRARPRARSRRTAPPPQRARSRGCSEPGTPSSRRWLRQPTLGPTCSSASEASSRQRATRRAGGRARRRAADTRPRDSVQRRTPRSRRTERYGFLLADSSDSERGPTVDRLAVVSLYTPR
mmetsp:Transcript_16924/g.55524  ORF Transcript_16924/g.55524 Transcript_16924/m.55524 type:complete len:228 (-) Transcript_16924:17-700(-)